MSSKPADESLVKNVRALLNMDVGDRHVLEQVLRAARNGELVSNHERDYVESLLAKHADSAPKTLPRTQEKATSPSETGSSSRTIVVAGGGVAAVAVVIAVVFLMSSAPNTPDVMDPVVKPALTVAADSDKYGVGDFIFVEGLSNISAGDMVEVTISGPAGQVWNESIRLKDDGSFFTMTLAGHGGWATGTYALSAAHGEEISMSTFDFAASGE